MVDTNSLAMMDPNSRRRVKLYMLNAERMWDDRGTGYISSMYVEKFRGMCLLVRSEDDGKYICFLLIGILKENVVDSCHPPGAIAKSLSLSQPGYSFHQKFLLVIKIK